MKRLLKYLNKYKKESILGPLFKLLEASFELMVPLVMARIIDIGIVNEDKGYVGRMGLILVSLGMLGFAASVTAQYFCAKAAVGFSTRLRGDMYKHINTLSYADMDKVGTSTLITRITNDINQLQNGLNMALRLFLRSPFIVFGAMIMAFTVDVKSAIIFVITIPALAVVVFGVMLASIPLYKKVQSKLDRVMLLVRENISGARVIRAFNNEENEIAVFNEESKLLKNMQLLVGRISAILNPVTFIIVNVATIAILWLGGKQVDTGILTKGEVLALVNYMAQILVELVKLAQLIILINKSLASANRVVDVFDTKNTMEEGEKLADFSDVTTPLIEFKDVSFSYVDAAEHALEHIDFTVNRGETVGIIGGTGSGKSTLVNLITRFYDTTEGEVIIGSNNVKEYTTESLRDRVGVVPQRAMLFRGSIRDNIRWGKNNATDEEIYKALEIAQAREIVEGKEGKLDYVINQGSNNLSGGQKQRITIARALVKKPDILILDDSASALDYATDAKLRKAIKENTDDMTVFIVSQRSSSIRNADKIAVLDDGKLVGLGTHKELYKNCPIYQEICLSQLSKKEAM